MILYRELHIIYRQIFTEQWKYIEKKYLNTKINSTENWIGEQRNSYIFNRRYDHHKRKDERRSFYYIY